MLTTTAYKHFVIVFVACTILCDSNDKRRNHYLQYARDLLKLYVDKSRHIYGSTFVVYNVHSLVHVADDATKFNCSLNDLSAFPFENYLQTLKYYVRNSKNPTAQVVKRIEEIEWHNNEENLTSGYRYISTKPKDNCFILKSEDYVFIKEKRPDGYYLCDIVKQRHTESFFKDPCDSKIINVAFVKNPYRSKRKLLQVNELSRKVVCLSYQNGHVLIPLLHGDEHAKNVSKFVVLGDSQTSYALICYVLQNTHFVL